MRWLAVGSVFLVALALAVLGWLSGGWVWWVVAAVATALGSVGVYDLVQRAHSVTRNYPILGHARFLMEEIRPEIRQYFIESNTEGRPFDRELRDLVYDRAKGNHGEEPFGTQRDVDAVGYEFVVHSMRAKPKPDGPQPKVRLGGPECTKPYDIALLNVSAMSFGSLSGNAIEALNGGAARGGFAHDTGEGSISVHHRKYGGDLIMEVASGYFGCRTDDGRFDPEKFAQRATLDQVKAVNIKLSQGAKPGLGGLLPGSKVTPEVAAARGVPVGATVVSPPSHNAFHTPIGLMEFIAELRELSGGKPVGFKLCVGSRREFLALCKAMLATDITPDFIIVDGSEGGTGAGPVEFEDHVGMPLTEGLMFVHNALVGVGLREQIKIGASGKVATGIDIVKRVCQGADFTLAARAMMFAVGCIQAQKCHTNTCPVGVATQDPARARALVVEDKITRVYQYQDRTVNSALQLVSSMGLDSFEELTPRRLFRRVDPQITMNYYELFEWLEHRQLLTRVPDGWHRNWVTASAETFDAVEVADLIEPLEAARELDLDD
ncbi:FMN-binding glutamate synthase family protein [Gordonia sp. X0973]|uniref:FMN-binding glutamate synthase family protein n=1 Tax=Gordonia sp. X0973 TaxID=2742602 RepID=UPI000F541E79|nr:FMN-binding glutamate synthase family protein [Gordonia sp. X0973]QKT08021.1 FMN-binding glutamate synthase family protein [Gordonia sp. X0973]